VGFRGEAPILVTQSVLDCAKTRTIGKQSEKIFIRKVERLKGEHRGLSVNCVGDKGRRT